jgi:hypothetical protein
LLQRENCRMQGNSTPGRGKKTSVRAARNLSLSRQG